MADEANSYDLFVRLVGELTRGRLIEPVVDEIKAKYRASCPPKSADIHDEKKQAVFVLSVVLGACHGNFEEAADPESRGEQRRGNPPSGPKDKRHGGSVACKKGW